jgi:uncharacterized membrane protein
MRGRQAARFSCGKSVAFVVWTQLSMIVVPALLGAAVAVEVVVQAMLASRD